MSSITGEVIMKKWQVYELEPDIDGSRFWVVNGEYLNHIGYHFHRNVPEFYDQGAPYNWSRKWDFGSEAREDLILADNALSILADYFEEQPTEEQVDQGQYKCWKYHLGFKRFLRFRDVITSDNIADWIENEDKQYLLEEDLIKRLKNLSVAVSIVREHDDYTWAFLDHRGTAPTFPKAVEAALEYAMDKLLTYLEIFTETPDKNMLP